MQTMAAGQSRGVFVASTQPPRRIAAGVRAVPLLQQQRRSSQLLAPRALGGGPETEDTPKSKGGIKREEEPEEYWKSEAERRGDSPFKDPLALIGIVSIFLPFILLGVAIATGLVDVNVGR